MDILGSPQWIVTQSGGHEHTHKLSPISLAWDDRHLHLLHKIYHGIIPENIFCSHNLFFQSSLLPCEVNPESFTSITRNTWQPSGSINITTWKTPQPSIEPSNPWKAYNQALIPYWNSSTDSLVQMVGTKERRKRRGLGRVFYETKLSFISIYHIRFILPSIPMLTFSID